MFENEVCKATIQNIAGSFSPRGMLGSEAASVGIYLLGEKYAGSDKLVVPYWVTVSSLLSFLCVLNVSV